MDIDLCISRKRSVIVMSIADELKSKEETPEVSEIAFHP